MKIAVCGSAPSSAHLAPYHDKSGAEFAEGRTPTHSPPHIDEEWEIWGCSPGLYGVAPRATRWFELHRWEPGQSWFSPEYVQYLKNFKGPVYTGGPIPEIPNHIVYPIEDVENQFSAFFLTSSLSLMAALAIQTIEQVRKARQFAHKSFVFDPSVVNLDDINTRPGTVTHIPDGEISSQRDTAIAMLPAGVDPAELDKDDSDDVIGFWGVDMSANEEYSRQKPGCWFFGIQILEHGIGLYYPTESDLFCPEPIYGISEWDHEYIKATARMRELSQRHTMAQQQIQQAGAEMAMIGGARDDLTYMIKNWMAHKYKLEAGKVLRKLP